jgi:lysophospholipase L1-like esterase
MKSHAPLLAALSLAALPGLTFAQIATVDLTNPEGDVLSYDEDPELHAPDIPEKPTVIYTDGTATDYYTQPVTSTAPVVQTSEPDTYTLSAARVYYTAPVEPPGPPRQSGVPMMFDLGPGPVAEGYTQVTQYTAYTPETGYGWGDISKVAQRDRGAEAGSDLERDFCIPQTPFYVDLPNGYYDISLVVGDYLTKSGMSVRAEGFLSLGGIGAPAGRYARDTFRIQVTDGRLRLEFFATVPQVNAITITPVPAAELEKTYVYLAGDSTVSGYSQALYPLTGWGVPLGDYFADNVVVANHALAGRSSKSFVEEGSLGAIDNLIKAGDYLFVMFAINDSADDNSQRKTKPESTFKAFLRLYVNSARAKGAIPVFVTSQIKRTYDAFGRFTNSVQGYPQAMRELGAELNVPVIDLNRMSIGFFTAIGPEAAKDSYMYLDAGEYPGWPNGSSDYIHFQYNGANQLARLVARGAAENQLLNMGQLIRSHRKSTAKPAPEDGYRALFNSNGFEPLEYLPLQDLSSYAAWKKDGGSSKAAISTNSTQAGMQSLQVIRAPQANADTRWSVASSAPDSRFVAIDVDMKVNLSGTPQGPGFGLEAYDGTKLIGSFSFDAGSGDLLYQTRSGQLVPTGMILTGGQYYHFTLEVDQARKRYSVYVNDDLVITDRFVDKDASVVTSSSVATYHVGATTADTETGTAYLDNLIIQAN